VAEDRIESDHVWTGSNRFLGDVTLPDGCIDDDTLDPSADLGAEKLEHQYEPLLAQTHADLNVAARRVVHRVRGLTGTIEGFFCGNTVAATGGDSTTIDLYKNGASILSAAVTLNSGAGVAAQAGTLSATSLVAGDVLSVVVTISGTNVGKGVWGQVILREKAD
jgi:hypothetical protein